MIKFDTNLKGLNQLNIVGKDIEDIEEEYEGSHTFFLSDDEAKDLAKQIVDKMQLVV